MNTGEYMLTANGVFQDLGSVFCRKI
ncbi:hypothetical protein EMIT0P265_40005 [Pseudomonas zeae]